MPRFRTGTKVPLNVYDGDLPIFQAHSAESAAELVELLNLGHRADEFTKAYNGSLADAMGLTSTETPSDRHESAVEGSGPQGEPETAEGHTEGPFIAADGSLWRRSFGWSGHWCGFRPGDPCEACFEKVDTA